MTAHSAGWARVRRTWHIRREPTRRHPNRVRVFGGCMSNRTSRRIHVTLTEPPAELICPRCAARLAALCAAQEQEDTDDHQE